MKNSWLIWLFIVGVVVTVLVAFNYQGSRNTVPLSEIFPDEKTAPVDIAYEFVDENAQTMTPQPAAVDALQASAQEQEASAPPLAVAAAPSAQAPAEIKAAATSAAPAAAAPAPVAQAKAETKASASKFTIQIASFKTKDAADSNLKKVQEKGYAGYVVSKDLGDKGTWHRLYVGTYQTKPEAEQELTKVKSDFPSSFIISPK